MKPENHLAVFVYGECSDVAFIMAERMSSVAAVEMWSFLTENIKPGCEVKIMLDSHGNWLEVIAEALAEQVKAGGKGL